MSTQPAPASGKAAALPAPVCHQATSDDQCQCVDCRLFFPGGPLWCFPHGNICDGCKDERTDNGIQAEAFGTSARQAADSTSLRTAALPAVPQPEPQGSNRA